MAIRWQLADRGRDRGRVRVRAQGSGSPENTARSDGTQMAHRWHTDGTQMALRWHSDGSPERTAQSKAVESSFMRSVGSACAVSSK